MESSFSPYRRPTDSPSQSLYYADSLPLKTFSSSQTSHNSDDSIHHNDLSHITNSQRREPGQDSSFIPPPPVQSVLFEGKGLPREEINYRTKPTSMLDQPLHALGEESGRLTKKLQGLLDEQLAALFPELAPKQPPRQPQQQYYRDDVYGSRSQFGRSSYGPYGRQPPPKKPGLRTIRKALSETMHQFAEVKNRERKICAAEIQKRQKEIQRLETWARQREGLERALDEIHSGPEEKRLSQLQKDYSDLEREISALQARLNALQSRQRSLAQEITTQRDRLSTRAAPASSQLQTLNRTIHTYLRSLSPPTTSPASARQHFELEATAFSEQRDNARAEEEALLDGIKVWEDVCAVVTGFEARMRERVLESRRPKRQGPRTEEGRGSPELMFKSGLGRRKLAGSTSGSLNSSAILPTASPPPLLPSPPPTAGNPDGGPNEILQDVQHVIDILEAKVQESQERGWNLLTCCLLHELEAFNVAREKLESGMGASKVGRAGESLLGESMAESGFVNSVGQKQVAPTKAMKPTHLGQDGDVEDDLFATANPWSSWSSPLHTKASSPTATKRTLSDPFGVDGNLLDSPEPSLDGLLEDGVDESAIEEMERTIVLAPDAQSQSQPQTKEGKGSAFWEDDKAGPREQTGGELVDFDGEDKEARNHNEKKELVDFGRQSSEHSREEEDPVPTEFMMEPVEMVPDEVRRTGLESELAGLRLDGK